MAVDFDVSDIAKAVSKGVSDGNREMVQALSSSVIAMREDSTRRHDLRGKLETVILQLSDVSGDLKAFKGTLVSLNGQGDGSSGSVPALQREVRKLTEEVGELRSKVEMMGTDVTALRQSSTQSSTFMAGWKGVAIALGILGSCFTIIGATVAGVLWLYQHH